MALLRACLWRISSSVRNNRINSLQIIIGLHLQTMYQIACGVSLKDTVTLNYMNFVAASVLN